MIIYYTYIAYGDVSSTMDISKQSSNPSQGCLRSFYANVYEKDMSPLLPQVWVINKAE